MNKSERHLRGELDDKHKSNSEQEFNVAIYARTSSASQRFGHSIEGQVRRCWDRCQQMDWTVTHVFRDEAVSGKDPDRPMFQKLLSQAEAGAFDVVVVWKLDRFSRSLMHAVQLEKQLRDWGISLHSITEMINTTTPAGRFNFRSISSAAEFERDLSKQRSQMGMTELALEHKWPNDHPPLGYQKCDDDTLEIVPEEAEIVESIFLRYIELQSMPELAEEFNEDGIETNKGKEWTARGIGDIIQNELYIGHYSVAEVEKYVPEYQIIQEDTFEQATKIRTRFQRDSAQSEREEMSKSRKEERVKAIAEQFHDFLEKRSISET